MQNLKSQAHDKMRTYVRRKIRVWAKIKAAYPDFRVIVNKTNKYMKAQVLDTEGKVVASIIDKAMKAPNKVERSAMAGETLAGLLKEKWVKKVTFDRNWHLYHGRVKAMADGLRKWGIQL